MPPALPRHGQVETSRAPSPPESAGGDTYSAWWKQGGVRDGGREGRGDEKQEAQQALEWTLCGGETNVREESESSSPGTGVTL